MKILIEEEFVFYGGFLVLEVIYLKVVKVICDFYIDNMFMDGIFYWDIGVLNLYKLGDYFSWVLDFYNDFELIDSFVVVIVV